MASPSSAAVLFNAHHAPVGAFASFTLGQPGASGGLGLELGRPANESLFIGAETADGAGYEALPFFASSADASTRYDVAAGSQPSLSSVRAFPVDGIQRDFSLGSDTWRAGDVSFTVFSAPKAVPDPARATVRALKAALVPAVIAELTLDNREGARPRTVFFGWEGADPFASMRRIVQAGRGGFVGMGQGTSTAIVSDTPGMRAGQGFTFDQILRPDREENLAFGLGAVTALVATVPAGRRRTFRFAICFHRDGLATAGLSTRYAYARHFPSIEDVAAYALAHFDEQRAMALAADRRLARSRLSVDQRFHLAHAVRSYFGSTEILETLEGEPLWAVNEGEYRMINTFDLTVDHLFFELDQNPWVVRNQLDWFCRRYQYTDRVRLPGDPTEYPGGISFTHDMGVGNCFSRPGHSAYEKFGLHGCFSQMTHEQLVNWVCCAVSYVRRSGDTGWMKRRLPIFRACLRSLIARDHPDASQRDGIMSADSSRCRGGSEITTYDSLDASLGQARNNLYLGVKTWAAYIGLEDVFVRLKHPAPAAQAGVQAARAAATIAGHLGPEGWIPAILGEGSESRIIPAIEGLVFPQQWGLRDAVSPEGKYGSLIRALGRHLQTILVPGVCLFPEGGWKLSSTNDNSWLSKIYLCQDVARTVFKRPADPKADAVHRAWLLDARNTPCAWSDQMVAGEAKGSKYYPRGVTAWLWLQESTSRR